MQTINIDRRGWFFFIIGLIIAAVACVWMFSYHETDGGGRELTGKYIADDIFTDGWATQEDEMYSRNWIHKVSLLIVGTVERGQLVISLHRQDGTMLEQWKFKAGDEIDMERSFAKLNEQNMCVKYSYTENFEGDLWCDIQFYCLGYKLLDRLGY